jgi:hypothetical protein
MAVGDIDSVKKRLRYNKDSGVFTWAESRGCAKPGDVASSVNSLGYCRVKVDGVSYLAHRLAWAFVNGEFPKSDIDHVNGIKTDNRIENLRLATRSENQCNRGKHANNKSGFKGVNWNQSVKKWAARCMVNGKRTHIGYFDDVALAAAAYQQVAVSLHGRFFRGV